MWNPVGSTPRPHLPAGGRRGWITTEEEAAAGGVHSETDHCWRVGVRADLVPGTAVPTPGGRRGDAGSATADCEKCACRGIDCHADHKEADGESACLVECPAVPGPEPGLSGRLPCAVDEDHLPVDAVPRHHRALARRRSPGAAVELCPGLAVP